MSNGGESKDVFDVERIRQIIQLMEEHDLGEVDLQQGEEKIRLSRSGTVMPAPMMPMPAAVPNPAAALNPGTASTGGDPADAHAGTVTINAPMIGTFYSRSNPNAEPFIKVGDRIQPDTVVCIVEAMKVFNEIPAEVAGEVLEILIPDGDAVDFGKAMIRVRPNG